MTGILIVDKPEGPTSFDIVRSARRWCRTRRVGHAGTLDPFATGVLPVAVGQATRLVEYLMDGDKEYLATLRLGAATDTQDLDGRVIASGDWQLVGAERFVEVCQDYVGAIAQVPPMYSAIKMDGQPLYRLARQGVEVERQPRQVRIDAIELLAFDLPDVRIRVACGKGTYIRTLCHDIGQQLGCGAHLIQLRRTRSGGFGETDAVPVAELERMASLGEKLPLLTPAQALTGWPGLEVDGFVLKRLRDGVAPRCQELDGGCTLEPGRLVKFVVGPVLVAVARFAPGKGNRGIGDFQILKVFPEDTLR
ncbi:MAG: tRNA pseudouridine(55) synthase TruB [Desulfuromonas sp.]|nr:MAG: tRNA pseudouridine(55) synthase TruB [Desulfuromonas sp.]